MQASLAGELAVDSSLGVFVPERRDAEMSYGGLQCACGSTVFHLSGWPRVTTGRGGFFWRAFSRVWREARMPMEAGEPLESPFWLPVFARCDVCGREAVVLDAAGLAGRMPLDTRGEPRESARCRACRRGSFALVVGATGHEGEHEDPRDREQAVEPGVGPASVAVELVMQCAACRRQARIAWSDARPSEQDVRLDLLYGRR